MSEEWGQQDESTAANASPGPTAGALLRQAREAAGLHIAALAVALKVPVRKLEALEEDRYDLMTDSVFVRGLAASVCRTLKIDPQPVLERLPQTVAPRLVRDSDGVNTPFRAPSDRPPASMLMRLMKPSYVAVFVLLVGALALIVVPPILHDDAPKEASKAEAPVAVVAVEPLPAPVAAPVVVASAPAVSASEAKAPAVTASAPAVPAVTTAAASSAVAVASTPVAVAAASAPAAAKASAPVASTAAGVLVIRASGPTWVEITDAKGNSAVKKMLSAGESAAANGPLPIRVVIGRSDVAQVLVRGKPFDMKPHTRADNLARFDVK